MNFVKYIQPFLIPSGFTSEFEPALSEFRATGKLSDTPVCSWLVLLLMFFKQVPDPDIALASLASIRPQNARRIVLLATDWNSYLAYDSEASLTETEIEASLTRILQKYLYQLKDELRALEPSFNVLGIMDVGMVKDYNSFKCLVNLMKISNVSVGFLEEAGLYAPSDGPLPEMDSLGPHIRQFQARYDQESTNVVEAYFGTRTLTSHTDDGRAVKWYCLGGAKCRVFAVRRSHAKSAAEVFPNRKVQHLETTATQIFGVALDGPCAWPAASPDVFYFN